MSDAPEDQEKQLRIELMVVQIEHYKTQIKWEPWKAMAVAAGAGAGAMAAMVALSTAILRVMVGH